MALEAGSRSFLRSSWTAALVALAAAPSIDAAPRAAANANATRAATTFSGRAKVASGKVVGAPLTVCDSGSLAASGGALNASLLSVNVPGIVKGSAAHSTVIGQGERSYSEAGLSKTSLTCLGVTIETELMFSRAEALCVNGSPQVAGFAEISCVAINGDPFDITGETNQTIAVPGGKIVFNEQIKNFKGASGELTVNCMHLTLLGGLVDVVVGSAKAGIVCGSIDCEGGDFATGCGSIASPQVGATACFAFTAGRREGGGLFGSVVFSDRGSNGPDVQSTSVTAYTAVNATKRKIEGLCKVDGVAGFRYTLHVEDKGSRGEGDTFMIDLSTGYWASGSLQGGDIEFHVPCE